MPDLAPSLLEPAGQLGLSTVIFRVVLGVVWRGCDAILLRMCCAYNTFQSSIMQLRSMQQRTRRAAQVRTTGLRGEGAELVGNVGLLIMHVSTFT